MLSLLTVETITLLQFSICAVKLDRFYKIPGRYADFGGSQMASPPDAEIQSQVH